MVATLASIGPAVLNGGISTILAISMLIMSRSHVFTAFFKVQSKLAILAAGYISSLAILAKSWMTDFLFLK